MNSPKTVTASLWPEGYGAGPGPSRQYQTYYCQRCGAIVMNIGVHTAWHGRVEPAEEETKAEAESDLDMHPDAVYGREYVEQAKVRRIARAVKECDTPSSSPVVPAPTETGPTETGPWPTWDDVPSGIKYRESPRRGWGTWWWINRNGIRRLADFCGEEVATTIAIPVGPFEAVYQS